MIKLDKIPAGAPDKFVYMLSKADLYLEIGPDAYRSGDAFGMPEEDCTKTMLATIRRGMKQICQFRGLSPDKPFINLDIDGFYVLMNTLHFKLETQVLAGNVGKTMFLDEMHMVHVMDGEKIVLYNAVPTPSARRALPMRKKKKGER